MATVDLNTVPLYYERRGDGPPLLFVPGAAGDAGIWDTVVDAFADEFTVVTYVESPGAHVPHLTHPQEFVEALRPTFERMWPLT
jgi:pimeloyl-ACP methyl ester carboxylesterase